MSDYRETFIPGDGDEGAEEDLEFPDVPRGAMGIVTPTQKTDVPSVLTRINGILDQRKKHNTGEEINTLMDDPAIMKHQLTALLDDIRNIGGWEQTEVLCPRISEIVELMLRIGFSKDDIRVFGTPEKYIIPSKDNSI